MEKDKNAYMYVKVGEMQEQKIFVKKGALLFTLIIINYQNDG